MLKKTFIILLFVILITPAFAWQGTVVKVSDGDTLWVRHGDSDNIIKIRLFGIDAPEGKQPYGDEATIFLTTAALNHQVAVIDLDTDRYRRNVSIVVLDEGYALQELLLFAGYAWVYPEFCKRCTIWKELEKQAREAKRGLWQDKEPTPPWLWRK